MDAKLTAAGKVEDPSIAAANKAKEAGKEVAELSNDEITQRIRMIEGNMRAMKV